MTRREIRKKFDEIVDFAEVERFLDTPVKRYSSGMYVRLAFAVAAHLEPEILVIDEVLAVGDVEFQKKCLGKMDEVSRREGRTVLFVSHNMGVIGEPMSNSNLARGRLDTKPGKYQKYHCRIHGSQNSKREQTIQLSDIHRPSAIQEDRLRLQSLNGSAICHSSMVSPIKAAIWFKTRAPVSDLTVGIGFSSFDGKRLLTYDADFQEGFRPAFLDPGLHSVEVEIQSLPLAPDIYGFDIGCRSGDFHPLDYLSAVVELDVGAGPNTPAAIVRKDAGVRLTSKWSWK